MTTQEPEVEHLEIAVNGAEQAAPQEKRSLSSALLGSTLYLVFFTGMTLFNSHPPRLHPVVWAVITPITTVAYLLILVYTIRLICRFSLTARLETLAMVTALFIFIVINPVAIEAIWGLINGKSVGEVFQLIGGEAAMPAFVKSASVSIQHLYKFIIEITVPFFLILTGVYFGQLLARIVRERGMLVPVSIISGLIDFWGVYWGPVGAWSEQAPAMVGMATAATASAATPEHVLADMPRQLQIISNISPPQNIGIGDFVFLAFFLACAYRLGFSARRTMWGIIFGLLAATLLMAMDGSTFFGHTITIDYLPGLVFICAGAMLANLRVWRLSRPEWAMTGVLAGILLVFIGFSIARAEINKPLSQKIGFTLTADSKREMVTAALERSLAGKRTTKDTLLLFGQFEYDNTGEKPVLKDLLLLAIARSPNPSLRNTRQISLWCAPEKMGSDRWRVAGIIQSPPDMAYRFMPREAGDDELTIIGNARGVPRAALALIDEIETMPATADDEQIILMLSPQKMQLAGKTGNILKEYDVKEYSKPNSAVPREVE